MKTFKKLLIAASALLTLAGISSCGQNNPTIEGSIWKLIEMNGVQNPVFGEADYFTIIFENTEHKIAGAGACNRFFGNYKIENNSEIDIEVTGATMMACPNIELEKPYFDTLEEADNYKIEKGILSLTDDGKVIAKFKKYKISE